MSYENNFIPIITKPTRIIDHTKTLTVFTQTCFSQIKSGIALFDIYHVVNYNDIVSLG